MRLPTPILFASLLAACGGISLAQDGPPTVLQSEVDEQRALLDQGRDAGFDFGAVLSRYAGGLEGTGSTKVAKLPRPKARGKR